MQIAYGIGAGEENTMRYAIYFTPGPDDALTCIAANWLGRDPFTGALHEAPATEQMSATEIAFHTAAPRRYGFHATLKAPFRLAEGESEASLDQALATYAATLEPVVLPRLVVGQIDGFFALVPGEYSPALNRFAGDIVAAFDRFRAPLTESEIERRNPDAMSQAEFRNLCQWGYPYVFDTFRFHMTLTGRVNGEDSTKLRASIDAMFAEELDRPFAVNGLALFVEHEPGAPFMVHSHHALGRQTQRKTA
jgi:putative phosphonate metabolism protein